MPNTIQELVDQQVADADTVENLSRVAASLEASASLVKAKLAYLTRALPRPREVETPEWALSQLADLGDSKRVPAVMVYRTQRILGAACAAAPNLEATIEESSPGRVGIEWAFRDRYLKWIVRQTEAAWPGVEVESLQPDPNNATALKSTMLYDMHSLISQLTEDE